MKVSRAQVTEHRHKILDAASRLFRERGYDGVSVAEIMGAAGLTHGGFYGHFDSKDDLITQTLAHLTRPELDRSNSGQLRSSDRKLPAARVPRDGAGTSLAGGATADRSTPVGSAADGRRGSIDATLAEWRARYLSPRHRDDRAGGCPVAALGGETVRQSAGARAVMTQSLRRQIDRFAATAPGATDAERRQAATGNWAAMVGAVVLARLADDPALADQVLRDTRAWLDASDAQPAAKSRSPATRPSTGSRRRR